MSKIAIVTGASRGIGAACAIALAQDGMCVAVCYRQNEAKANEVCAQIIAQGGTAHAFYVNVADEASVNTMYQDVCQTLGVPSVLVNNAGIAKQQLFTDVTATDWDEMFNVCVRGAFLCSRAVLPKMIAQQSGRIIQISSIWGCVGASCEVPYSAAKAALIGFTKALAKEEGPSGITVNCIAPGVIETDMLNAFTAQDKQDLADETPLCRLGAPQEIAQAVSFLASEKASFITGQVLGVDGGFGR